MTHNELINIMAWVMANFPNMQEKDIRPTVQLWERMYSDVPKEKFEGAIVKVLARSDYFPTVAAISKALTTEDELTPIEAWGEVKKAVIEFGYPRQKQALDSMSLLTRKVVNAIGWQDICASEESDVIRGQFMNHYATLTKRAKDMAVLPKGLRQSGMGSLSDEMKRIVENMAGDTKLIGGNDDE